MLVTATAIGFFGSLRQVGDPFEVPDGAKASWFKPVDPPADKPVDPPADKPAKAPKVKPDSTDLA